MRCGGVAIERPCRRKPVASDRPSGRLTRSLTDLCRVGRTALHRADEMYDHISPMVKELHDAGQPLQAIADELNEQGHTTRRGKAWNRMQVSRVLKRAG